MMGLVLRQVQNRRITVVMTAAVILPGMEDFRRIRMQNGKVSEDGA
jgi:hypothetical protein